MKIAFLTNLTAQDSLPILQRLGELTEHSLEHVYFYNTLAEAKKSPLKILREFGVRRVAEKLCSSLWSRVRRLLFKGALKRFVQPQTAYEWAISRNLPHSVVDNLNDSREIQALAQRNLDLLLVCVCKNILRTPTMQTPKLGTLNIHPSLLPKYRGPMPVFWMLYFGETTAGVSFQKMIAQIDAGPLVAQYSLPISAGSTEAKLSRELFLLAADHLGEVLAQVANPRTASRSVTSSELGSYHSFPTAKQQAELRNRRPAGS